MTTRADDTANDRRFPFTLRRVAELSIDCPGIYRDIGGKDSVTGLAVRITKGGAKSFVYDRNLSRDGKRLAIRMAIGKAPTSINDGDALSIPQARAIATQLNIEAQAGRDPRAVKMERSKQDAQALESANAERDRLAVTLRQVWDEYLIERSPDWSDRHLADAIKLAGAGGERYKRGEGKTKAGPLAGLMKEPIAAIDQDRITAWAKVEGARRATQARLARRHLIACMRWCMEEAPRNWRGLVQPEALRLNRTARKRLGKTGAKSDRLERPHLAPFFEALAKHPTPNMRALITGLLMTGARMNELSGLKWVDIDWRWKSLTIHDKATQETRVIPLPPYMESTLRQLERNKGESVYVFPSRDPAKPLSWANKAVTDICRVAGVPHVTVHGLRRSFASLAESADIPAGPIAQIMGHTPNAIAEKHYKRRSLDELRKFADHYEAWVLDAAGIEFTPDAEGLRLVKG